MVFKDKSLKPKKGDDNTIVTSTKKIANRGSRILLFKDIRDERIRLRGRDPRRNFDKRRMSELRLEKEENSYSEINRETPI